MSLKQAKRIASMEPSSIHSTMRYAAQYSNCISLGQGTPSFATPQFIYDGIRERANTDPSVGMYATSAIENELKNLIAKKFNSTYGFTPRNSDIILTVGGVAALTIALLGIIDPGDEIIFFDPSYPIHLSQIELVEGTPVFISYDEENNWKFPLEKIEKSITSNTKALILTNPNNPTGTILTEDEVTQLSKIILKHDIYLILDEAYEYLCYEHPFYSPMQIPALRDRIILAKSFSKEFAMTGFRIGYAYAPSIAGSIIALSSDEGEKFIEQSRRMYEQSKKAISERLQRLPQLFSYIEPQGAYYAFPKIIPDIPASDFVKQLIDEVQVITIGGDCMGPAGQRHIRLSFCIPPEKIHLAFDRIDLFAKKHGYI